MEHRKLVISLIAAFILFLVLSPSSADELCVDPTDPMCYSTIGTAVTASEEYDTIRVSAGIYNEEITIDKNIKLFGDNPDTTIIYGGSNAIIINEYEVAEIVGFSINSNGTGVYLNDYASLKITNCIIAGNGEKGIHLENDISQAEIINCVISRNSTYGIWKDEHYGYGSGPVAIINCIISRNTDCGIRSGGTLSIDYNDVWANSGGDYCSCSAGSNDISENPLFIHPDTGDFRLQENSPCKNTGRPIAVDLDPDGTRNDMGAYGGPGASSFCQYPDCGPVVTSISVSPLSVPQGDSITIQATGVVR